jgi:hypothetical protein
VVHVTEGARVKVEGFGLPFANPQDPEIEGWINDDKPLVDAITLLDFLQAGEFYLIVAQPCRDLQKEWDESRLPPPFRYPYGTEHSWHESYEALLSANKGQQFRPTFA